MNLSAIIYFTPHIISAIIFFILILIVFKKKENNLIKIFTQLMINCLFLAIFKILELISKSAEFTIFFSYIYYSFLILLPFMLLNFILSYIEFNEKNKKKILKILIVFPIVLIFFLLTNDFHNLFFKSKIITPITQGLFGSIENLSTLITIRGVVGFLSLIFNYSMIFLILGILIKNYFNSNKLIKKQYAILFIAIITPFLSNFLFVIGIEYGIVFGSDFTVFAFIITGILFLYSINSNDFLNISKFARNKIFEELKTGIIIIDLNNNIINFNSYAKKALNDFNIKPALNENYKSTLKKLKIKETAIYKLKNKKNEHYEFNLRELKKNNKIQGKILVITNITLIKKNEKIKNELEKQKNINKSRNDFIKKISKNTLLPLKSIIIQLEKIKPKINSKKEKEFFEKIFLNAENLNKMIEKIILLNKLISNENFFPKKINISKTIETIDFPKRVKKKIEKNIFINADEKSIIEAIKNIAENSLKYSNSQVLLKAAKNQSNAIITIEDKGKGIEKKLLNEIIKGNYLAKIDSDIFQKGFGMGLFFANSIINLNKGKLKIQSELKKGTKAIITLPLA